MWQAGVVTTERLRLRPFTAEDFDDFAALIRDKMAAPSSPYDQQWPTDDASLRGALDYIARDAAWFAIEQLAQACVIGFVVASRTGEANVRDIGYTLRTDYQRQGYAYEATRALMDYCMEALGIGRFTAGTAQCNGPSVRLLDKLGFVKVGEEQVCFARDGAGDPIVFLGNRYEYEPR